jgi:hypothetical protein
MGRLYNECFAVSRATCNPLACPHFLPAIGQRTFQKRKSGKLKAEIQKGPRTTGQRPNEVAPHFTGQRTTDINLKTFNIQRSSLMAETGGRTAVRQAENGKH